MRTYTVIVVNPLEQCDKDDKPAGMLFQYDYGQRIVFGGVELPQAYEVHFSNQKMGKSVTVIGDVTGIVDIPDALLLTGQDVHVWLYLHQGEDDGETVYYARIAVKGRAKPTHETPTPVQQDEITQAIAALNAAVEATEADASAAEASAEDAGRAQAAAEAAQDRAEAAQGAAESAQTGAETAQDKAEDAQEAAEGARDRAETAAAFLEDCSAEAETLTAGSDATASYSEGVFHFGIPRGQKGSKGDPGDRGPEGPTGPEGLEGPAGYSPTASVSKSGSTATISITDKTGTTTATVSDGEDGAPGQDGYTPVRGTDYWTAADQVAIVADVEADLIDDTAAAGDTTKVWSADKSSSELSGVLSALDSKAPVILRDASGDIVSFADGADGMPLASCVVQIYPVQSGTGDPSPQNVRSISGHDSAIIYRTGKNLLDMTVYNGGKYNPTVGEVWTLTKAPSDRQFTLVSGAYTVSPSSTWQYYTVLFPVKAGTSYHAGLTLSSTGNAGFSRGFLDKNGKVLYNTNSTNNPSTMSLDFDISSYPDAVYLYMVFTNRSSSSATLSVSDPQCEIGTGGTAYEAYKGQTYPISWQTAAGTVYGGTVDTKTGVLTVTWAGLILDGVTNKCDAFTDSGESHGFALNVGNLVPYAQSTVYVKSSHFNGAGYNARGDRGSDNTIFPTNSSGRLRIRYDAIEVEGTPEENIAAFNAYLVAQSNANTPVQVIYKLKTDQTYQLDPVQITALKESNIWADTGAIAVTYPADTQTYVDTLVQTATDPDGNVIQVSGSTPSITGESGKQYVCGTVDSISITPPSTGIIDVVFTSGTTPAVLTASGVVWPGWFNPNSLDASTTYEINIMNGLGGVMAWQT